jgi:hypothetical protein
MTPVSAEDRAAAIARFQACCVAGGVAFWVLGLVFFSLGLAGGALAVGQVLGFFVIFSALTAWSRRGVVLLPGARGFAIDFAILTVRSLLLAACYGGVVWLALKLSCS